MIVGLFDCIV